MTEEERRERIKLIKATGIAIMVTITIISVGLAALGILTAQPGTSQFSMLMIAGGAGILSVISSGLTFLRIDKIKSRGALIAGVACMFVSIAAMLIFALTALLSVI